MRLPAGTAGFRPRPHFLWAGGGFPLPAFFAAMRGADGLSGGFTLRSAKIVLRAVNGPSDGFLPVEPDSGCRSCSSRGAEHAPGGACDRCRAPAGCTAMPARSDALRGIGARAFSPAGLCAMIPPGGYGDAGRGLYIKEAATLPFRNVAAVWALRPVVRLILSVRSRRCPAGCCCVRRRRRYSNCRSVPLWPPRRRAGSQRSRSPSAVRSRRPKPRSSSSCPSTAGARTRRRPPLPT